jgi:hypothetical protein
MRTGVSQKKTERHAERCDSCGLWFEFLHPSADGRFLCRMCLTLEGGNRAAPLQPVTRRKTDWLASPAFSARRRDGLLGLAVAALGVGSVNEATPWPQSFCGGPAPCSPGNHEGSHGTEDRDRVDERGGSAPAHGRRWLSPPGRR